MKPNRRWNRKEKTFKFKIKSKSNLDYVNYPTSRRSVSGCAVFLEGVPVVVNIIMQKIVALLVTKVEMVTAVMRVQHMLYVVRVFKSMGLLVEYLIEIEIDNSGDVDLANIWSAGGRTKHEYFS